MRHGERRRFSLGSTRGGTFALAFLALVLSPASKAFAQDTSSYLEQQGLFNTYEPGNTVDPLLSRVDRYTFLNRGNSDTREALAPDGRMASATQSADTNDTTETITVTALRTENLNPYEDSEFNETIIDRLRIVSTGNPDLEGQVFLTTEEEDDDGWALSMDVLGSRRGETGPFVSFNPGRGEPMIAGGVRW